MPGACPRGGEPGGSGPGARGGGREALGGPAWARPRPRVPPCALPAPCALRPGLRPRLLGPGAFHPRPGGGGEGEGEGEREKEKEKGREKDGTSFSGAWGWSGGEALGRNGAEKSMEDEGSALPRGEADGKVREVLDNPGRNTPQRHAAAL